MACYGDIEENNRRQQKHVEVICFSAFRWPMYNLAVLKRAREHEFMKLLRNLLCSCRQNLRNFHDEQKSLTRETNLKT